MVGNRGIELVDELHAATQIRAKIQRDHLVERTHSGVCSSAPLIVALRDVVDQVDTLEGCKNRGLHGVVVCHSLQQLGAVALGKSRHVGAIVKHLEVTTLARPYTKGDVASPVLGNIENTLLFARFPAVLYAHRKPQKPRTALSLHRLVLEFFDTVQSLRNILLHHSVKLLYDSSPPILENPLAQACRGLR